MSKKTLVIVESPTKAKTISKFLGPDYTVEASFGHVRDLPKSKLSIDTEHNFTPKYIIPVKSKEIIAKLRSLAKNANKIILATDEDREGEAIAWHLVQAMDLGDEAEIAKGKEDKRLQRIVFHEITDSAIKHALENPRDIDLNLVDAQQARRILDRLVGYELSPFLWHKIRYGLSAGRVQSVAVRLVVEREREIREFKKQEYWTVEATLSKAKESKTFVAKLVKDNGKTLDKFALPDKSSAEKIVTEVNGNDFIVESVTVKEAKRNPAAPFTTSTLQQEAARKLGWSAKQTMMVAQKLYEEGHITYMRTDSLNLAASALAQIKDVITEDFGANYALPQPRHFTNKSKGAQEAHEAIRPTDVSKKGSDLRVDVSKKRLYDLIWKRTIACQMQPAILDQTAVDFAVGQFTFRSNGQVIKFEGFIRAYTEGTDDDGSEETNTQVLPDLKEKEKVDRHEVLPFQHFTEPPGRYSDATLIKALEAHGVGRPSTYAPTLATIQDRTYVEKEDKKYKPTEIGELVTDLLVENFPEIVDINFTSHIEEEFDDIAEGKIKWEPVIKEFYEPFKKHLKEKEESVQKQVEISTTPCPHCKKPMLIKFGRMGKFLACPEGEKITLPMPEEAAEIKALEEKTKDERCPICGKPMQVKRGRFGYFLSCTDYPTCKGVSKIWNKLGYKCPNCLESVDRKDRPGDIVEKKARGRGKPFYACTRYPDCEFIFNKKPENAQDLDQAYKDWLENKDKPKVKKVTKKKPTA